MVALDGCPTEDAVGIFLDHLVDPLLPARSSAREAPSDYQQQLVATQMHAVVLLYNYYHRKRHHQLKYEGFESFCKLAVVQKPMLLVHMKLMQTSDDYELNDLGKQLSVTEKAIMDACDISNSLDASKDVPGSEGWPISKIAVLLIDSRKENCFLQHGSITQGVWSLIEKDVAVSSCISEVTEEGKQRKKKIKVTRQSLKYIADEDCFQQIAFSLVKEATGINQSDLIIIGSDVVYSLSKEKTMARFYMMQCTQPKNDDVFQIPIKDTIDSLLGPLVTRSSGQWIVTPVVDYFHLLPYSGIMSDWFSREGLSNRFQDQMLELGSINVNNSKWTGEPYEPEGRTHVGSDIVEYLGSSADKSTTSPEHTDKNGCSVNGLCSINVDTCTVNHPQNEDECKSNDTRFVLDDHQNMTNSYLNSDLNGTAGNRTKVEMASSVRMPSITECRGENAVNWKASSEMICSYKYEKPKGDFAVVTDQSKTKDINRLERTVSSRENASQTALKALLTRRNKLTLLQRNIEDEIALWDKKIQNILSGCEDDSGLKIECFQEDCNDICLGYLTRERTYRHFEKQSSPQPIKMKRLSEAVLFKKNSCQELDDICYENNWILPTYRVSPSDGGFTAHVTVKGLDFECSTPGDPHSNPREARESAAVQMLPKLRSMANQAE